MPQLKVGVNLTNLGLPIRKALDAAATMGADAVQIDARGELNPRELSQSAIRQLKGWLEDRHLKVCAVQFQTRRGYNVPEDLQPRIEATKQAMRFAYELGTSVLVNQIGTIPESEEHPDWNLLLDALTDLGKFSQQAGAFLSLKTGTESGSRVKALIDALPEGTITVSFDPGSLIVHGFSASESLNDIAEHVQHVIAKDGVRDLAQGRGLEVPLGRGSVDFAEIIGRLEEYRFQGYFTVEREHSKNALSEIELAVQYLRQL